MLCAGPHAPVPQGAQRAGRACWYSRKAVARSPAQAKPCTSAPTADRCGTTGRRASAARRPRCGSGCGASALCRAPPERAPAFAPLRLGCSDGGGGRLDPGAGLALPGLPVAASPADPLPDPWAAAPTGAGGGAMEAARLASGLAPGAPAAAAAAAAAAALSASGSPGPAAPSGWLGAGRGRSSRGAASPAAPAPPPAWATRAAAATARGPETLSTTGARCPAPSPAPRPSGAGADSARAASAAPARGGAPAACRAGPGRPVRSGLCPGLGRPAPQADSAAVMSSNTRSAAPGCEALQSAIMRSEPAAREGSAPSARDCLRAARAPSMSAMQSQQRHVGCTVDSLLPADSIVCHTVSHARTTSEAAMPIQSVQSCRLQQYHGMLFRTAPLVLQVAPRA